jgi:3-deoxy-7-phosphoheptulonate synthase
MSPEGSNTTLIRSEIENVRVESVTPLTTPHDIKAEFPLDDAAHETVSSGRAVVKRILAGEDPRLLVVVGPCSIHDPAAALDYAKRLKALADRVSDRYFIVMRVYFEKPRTTVGWKGLINDPHLDESCDVPEGLRQARKLLLEINSLGLPAATEFLDPIIPQFIADLITWAAVGARTTESQTHREMASGLSMPVGFKNGTDGDVQAAIDAMRSSRSSHSFLGIDRHGKTSVVKTEGNNDCHVVLRGGRKGPNFEAEHTAAAVAKLTQSGLPSGLMVDCSHANSGKDPQRQPDVWKSVLEQRTGGDRAIIGAMLESFIHEGNQLSGKLADLKYGVSVTDGCMSWETTEKLFES